MTSIRERLRRLESKGRLLTWFVRARFFDIATTEELERYARDGALLETVSNRPSRLDRLERKSLIKLWKEDERAWEGRSEDERQYLMNKGCWPEQNGGLHYSVEEGLLGVEWKFELEEEAGLAEADTNLKTKLV
jgi:hypothetical protein